MPCMSSEQAGQKVHSYEQTRACAPAGSGVPHRSQSAFIATGYAYEIRGSM